MSIKQWLCITVRKGVTHVFTLDKVLMPVYVIATDPVFEFTSWAAGQPDNASQNCLLLHTVEESERTWSDEDCTDQNYFFCVICKLLLVYSTGIALI